MANADSLIREMKRVASLFIAAQATGDYQKMKQITERLTDLSSSFFDQGGSLDELASTFAGKVAGKE